MSNESLFVGQEIIARNVKMPDGSDAVLHFRKLTALEYRRFYIAESSDDLEVKAQAPAILISAAFVDEKGKPMLTKADVEKLSAEGLMILSKEIMAINQVTEKQKKS